MVMLFLTKAGRLFLFLLCFWGFSLHAGTSLKDAVAVVDDLYAGLTALMVTDKPLDFRARLTAIRPVLQRDFHFPLMASVAAGRLWRQADEQSRKDFVDVFIEYSASSYATNFTSQATGLRFEIKESFFLGESTNRARVNTLLYRPEGEPVKLDYALRLFGDEWRIVDIFLDGKISELALRRGQYRSVDVAQGGLAALAEHIQASSERLASAAEPPPAPPPQP